jgi:hypothetical protein
MVFGDEPITLFNVGICRNAGGWRMENRKKLIFRHSFCIGIGGNRLGIFVLMGYGIAYTDVGFDAPSGHRRSFASNNILHPCFLGHTEMALLPRSHRVNAIFAAG